MTTVIVLFTTVCVALVGAGVPQYDLSSLFLSDSEAAVHRVTRDADGHPNITCCGSGYNMPDEQRADMLDCKSQYGIEKPAGGSLPTKGAMGELKKKMACAGQCMGQKEGLLDSNNYVDVDKFTTSLVSFVVDADLKDFAQQTVKKCAEDANEKAKTMGEIEYNGAKCNVAAARAVLCSHVTMELSCPDNKKVKSTECDAKRELLKLMKQHADS